MLEKSQTNMVVSYSFSTWRWFWLLSFRKMTSKKCMTFGEISLAGGRVLEDLRNKTKTTQNTIRKNNFNKNDSTPG